jgi:minor histocompatibility antigen H13
MPRRVTAWVSACPGLALGVHGAPALCAPSPSPPQHWLAARRTAAGRPGMLQRRAALHMSARPPADAEVDAGDVASEPALRAGPSLPVTPEHLRGLNETAPFYLMLAAAQMLPFLVPSRGNVVDVVYFSVTAVSALVIGCKRSTLQASDLTEPLSSRQALFAPLLASGMLFGVYLLLKYTPIDIGLLFNLGTTLAGSFCLKEALDPLFHSALKLVNIKNAPVADLEKPEYEGEEVAKVYTSDIISASVAGTVVACYVFHLLPGYTFVFSNAIAIGIAARVLALVRPGSFVVAAGLLSGLCLYDIFWVFGSNVMVTVATQIDSPGKLLFPRSAASLASAASYPFAVLGLGDIVVPGIFVTLALALDANIVQKQPVSSPPSIVPAGPYFKAAVLAYALGLGTCFGINFSTHAAQPALLYLVPALISSSVIVGLIRGELEDVIKFRMPERGATATVPVEAQERLPSPADLNKL